MNDVVIKEECQLGLRESRLTAVASSMVGTVEWDQTTDVECFCRVMQVNCDGTIDMLAGDINETVGTACRLGEFAESKLLLAN